MNRGERRVACSVNLSRENRRGAGNRPIFFYKKVLTDENEYDIIGGPRAVAASGFHYNTRLALLSSGNFAQKLQKNIPKFVYFAQRKIFFRHFAQNFLCIFVQFVHCNLWLHLI